MNKAKLTLILILLFVSCSDSSSDYVSTTSYHTSREGLEVSDFVLSCEHSYCPESLAVVSMGSTMCLGQFVSSNEVAVASECFVEQRISCEDTVIHYKTNRSTYKTKCFKILNEDKSDNIQKSYHIIETAHSHAKGIQTILSTTQDNLIYDHFSLKPFNSQRANIYHELCRFDKSSSLSLNKFSSISINCGSDNFYGGVYFQDGQNFVGLGTGQLSKSLNDLNIDIYFEADLVVDAQCLDYNSRPDSVDPSCIETLITEEQSFVGGQTNVNLSEVVDAHLNDTQLSWAFEARTGSHFPKCLIDADKSYKQALYETNWIDELWSGAQLEYSFSFNEFTILRFLDNDLELKHHLETSTPLFEVDYNIALNFKDFEDRGVVYYGDQLKPLYQCL